MTDEAPYAVLELSKTSRWLLFRMVPRYDGFLYEAIRMVPSRIYDNRRPGEWKLPLQVGIYSKLVGFLGDRLRVEPALQERMAVLVEDAAITQAMKRGEVPAVPPADTPFVTRPYAHQAAALAYCLKRPAFALFMEMGTGKTKVVLDLLATLKRNALRDGQPWWTALVAAPVTVLSVWEKEAAVHQPSLRVKALTTGKSWEKGEQASFLREQGLADVVVVSYDALWRVQERLGLLRWSVFILDESTRIKHRATKQARAAVYLGDRAQRRYILTGTPTPNSPLELFNQIRFLDPAIFGNSYK